MHSVQARRLLFTVHTGGALVSTSMATEAARLAQLGLFASIAGRTESRHSNFHRGNGLLHSEVQMYIPPCHLSGLKLHCLTSDFAGSTPPAAVDQLVAV